MVSYFKTFILASILLTAKDTTEEMDKTVPVLLTKGGDRNYILECVIVKKYWYISIKISQRKNLSCYGGKWKAYVDDV